MHLGKTVEKLMNLRMREIDKEIGGASFRFTPKNDIEKIAENLKK
jgi:hypothetical protein